MSKFGDLFKVFKKSIGQNLENDPNDVTNVKNKLASLGRYNDDHKSGYIDAELDDSIRSYQRDRNLKSDGVINPGGETEATLIGEMIRPDENNIQMANAAIPWIIRNSPKAIKAGKDVWTGWRAISPSERQDEVDDIEEEQKRCERVKQNCRNKCSDSVLPTKDRADQGMIWRKCYNQCLEENNCLGNKY